MAQYIRGLLNSQSTVKLLDVLSDGSKVLAQVQQLRPDVVLVDALLQGRVKGLPLAEQIPPSGYGVPVIILTVPQNPVETDPAKGIHGVLAMPFSGFDLMNRIAQVAQGVRQATRRRARRGSTRSSRPKGGVGKTTIAFNLAVALGQADQRTVLIDGSPPVRRPALAAQGAGRRAVDPRPADRPRRRVRPPGRPLARPVRDRHPARPAAGRDGRDGHGPRHRQDPVAPAPGLRLDRDRHVVGAQRHQPRRSSTCPTRSSRSSPTTRRRSTTRSRSPTRSG